MSESTSWWYDPESEAQRPAAIRETQRSIQSKLEQLGFDAVDGASKLFTDRRTGRLRMLSLYDKELEALQQVTVSSTCPNPLGYGLPMRVHAQCAILRPGAIPPIRKRPTDAGYDIISNVDACMGPRGNVDIATGIALSVQRGYYYTVEGRSGLGTKHRVVPFSGTIDACYIGELYVMLTNNSHQEFSIRQGDRIAQLLVKEQIDLDIEIIDVFSDEYKSRGIAGFGSSGR